MVSERSMSRVVEIPPPLYQYLDHKYLECIGNEGLTYHRKFYLIVKVRDPQDNSYSIQTYHGPIGSSGTKSKDKGPYTSEDFTNYEIGKILHSKSKKGYKEVTKKPTDSAQVDLINKIRNMSQDDRKNKPAIKTENRFSRLMDE